MKLTLFSMAKGFAFLLGSALLTHIGFGSSTLAATRAQMIDSAHQSPLYVDQVQSINDVPSVLESRRGPLLPGELVIASGQLVFASEGENDPSLILEGGPLALVDSATVQKNGSTLYKLRFMINPLTTNPEFFSGNFYASYSLISMANAPARAIPEVDGFKNGTDVSGNFMGSPARGVVVFVFEKNQACVKWDNFDSSGFKINSYSLAPLSSLRKLDSRSTPTSDSRKVDFSNF